MFDIMFYKGLKFCENLQKHEKSAYFKVPCMDAMVTHNACMVAMVTTMDFKKMEMP